MNKRTLGKTGYQVSEVGFGAWAIGGSWGEVSADDALAALREALSQGVTFIDTADVYGDGRSEKTHRAGVGRTRGRARLRGDQGGPPLGATHGSRLHL